MGKYALIENDMVVQVQTKIAPGFIEVPEYVVCGMIKNRGEFFIPVPPQKPYDERRRLELAPLDGEGMDAMRKAIIDLMAAANLQPAGEFAAYMDKVNAIKARHPKEGG